MAKTVAAKSKPPTRRIRSAAAEAKTSPRGTKPHQAKPGAPVAKPKRAAASTKSAAAKTNTAAKRKAGAARPRTPRKPFEDASQASHADLGRAADDSSRGPRATIRMYRQGLGDCFLITLPRKKSAKPYRILIDCGVILGTEDAITKMTNVAPPIDEYDWRGFPPTARPANAFGERPPGSSPATSLSHLILKKKAHHQ